MRLARRGRPGAGTPRRRGFSSTITLWKLAIVWGQEASSLSSWIVVGQPGPQASAGVSARQAIERPSKVAVPRPISSAAQDGEAWGAGCLAFQHFTWVDGRRPRYRRTHPGEDRRRAQPGDGPESSLRLGASAASRPSGAISILPLGVRARGTFRSALWGVLKDVFVGEVGTSSCSTVANASMKAAVS